jgi:hypothetical protein
LGYKLNPRKKKIMALKRKDGTLEPNPTNHERDSRAAGINFQLSEQRQLFAPYSFLSHAQMTGEEEIAIHYTFGVVRLKGGHLGDIYSMLRGHELGSLNCDVRTPDKPDDARINEIVFEEIESASE